MENGKWKIKKATLLIHILFVAMLSSTCTSRKVYEAAATAEPPATDAINLNTATAAELERLPRIGPKTAANIIQFRNDNGPFRRVEELMQVHGISERKFLDIKPFIRTD